MKKTRLMFLLSLFLTSIPLVAQTEDEAKLAAVKFLQQKKGVTLSNLSTVKVVTGKSAATRSADGTAGAAVKGGDVYAFNADDGGFAVVCTGNGNTAVAGYSEKGGVVGFLCCCHDQYEGNLETGSFLHRTNSRSCGSAYQNPMGTGCAF